MARDKKKRVSSWPIPDEAIAVFRRRKAEKGISITRSVRDALLFAIGRLDAWF